jgi:predicted enzyme related to lactoylglutathione lyase
MAGKIVYLELPAKDAERARNFWSGLFGWEFADSQMPDMDYRMVRVGDDQGGAVYPSDEAVAQVRESGGQAEDKAAVPGMGWFAQCRDTEGNTFSLWQSDQSAG